MGWPLNQPLTINYLKIYLVGYVGYCMVCDTNMILDCGIKKNVDECISMSSEDYNVWLKFNKKYNDYDIGAGWDDREVKIHDVRCLDQYIGIRNVDYKFKHKLRSYAYWEKEFNKIEYKASGYDWKIIIEQMYADLNVERFLHHYMINISPNWKLPEKEQPNKLMIALLNSVIEGYLNESDRWDDALYTLENGGEGNFLHAHIVAKPNRKIIKSVDTHMNKGNHSVQLKKRWDKECKQNPKLVGYVGCLKGKFSIQKIVLRNSELIDDKKDYLIESKKPEGHTNVPQKYLNSRKEWSRID